MFFYEKLKCYQIALELLKEVNYVQKVMPRGLGNVNDQLNRALTSIVLNLSEGVNRKSSLDRKRFFDIAKASTSESASCFDILFALNHLSEEKYNHFKSTLLILIKMISKLH